MSPKAIHAIGRLAALSPKVVAYYAAEGLVDLSSPDAVVRLKRIKSLKRAGFALAEIRVILGKLDSVQGDQLAQVRELVMKHVAELMTYQRRLDTRMAEMSEMLEEIDRLTGQTGPDRV